MTVRRFSFQMMIVVITWVCIGITLGDLEFERGPTALWTIMSIGSWCLTASAHWGTVSMRWIRNTRVERMRKSGVKNRGQTPAKRVNDGAGVCPRFSAHQSWMSSCYGLSTIFLTWLTWRLLANLKKIVALMRMFPKLAKAVQLLLEVGPTCRKTFLNEKYVPKQKRSCTSHGMRRNGTGRKIIHTNMPMRLYCRCKAIYWIIKMSCGGNMKIVGFLLCVIGLHAILSGCHATWAHCNYVLFGYIDLFIGLCIIIYCYTRVNKWERWNS